MPRAQQFDTDRLLDAACTLAGESGPAAVSMVAVARLAGAPSGSLYHRFPSRAVLLGELWFRTVRRFQEGFLNCLETADPRAAAIAAARYVVDWCRSNKAEAVLLSHSRKEFAAEDWPDELKKRAEEANRGLFAALHELVSRLELDTERVMIALVDLPYAVVRRHLASADAIPESATEAVEGCVKALL